MVSEARFIRAETAPPLAGEPCPYCFHDPLERSGYLDEIGRENIFESKGEAIETIFRRLDPSVCAGCPRRVFRECHEVDRGGKGEREPASKLVSG